MNTHRCSNFLAYCHVLQRYRRNVCQVIHAIASALVAGVVFSRGLELKFAEVAALGEKRDTVARPIVEAPTRAEKSSQAEDREQMKCQTQKGLTGPLTFSH